LEALTGWIPDPYVLGKTVISGHNPQNSGETLAIGELECVVNYRYGEGG
jgi:hypothetical protein